MKEVEGTGAAVFAVSIDPPEDARGLRRDLGLTFPILSDPDMRLIRAFGMQGEMRNMGDMGYVIIDKQGRIRTRQIDRQFGEHIGQILPTIMAAKRDS